ncbi:MAG: carboxymuconolactone decarboxylase family protein [Solirubrobacterales bacterium]
MTTATTADPAIPRIAPGTRAEIGNLNFALARLLGAAAGGAPPNIFTTLARHGRLFRPWLRFAGALMPGGLLPRADSELLILRVAHNCGCAYEWSHHERLGSIAGLAAEEIERVREGPAAAGWPERQAALLRAADELHERRTISDSVWQRLRVLLSEAELIEVCMLVGHYEMVAMTLNALGVQPDAASTGPPTGTMRLLQAIANRRIRSGRGRR